MRRFFLLVSVAAALTLLAAACSSSSEEGSATTTSEAVSTSADDPIPPTPPPPIDTLEWTPCDEVECATLAVPLDYDEPDGPMIDIAVARIPASGADRIGSVVFNPGGPGGSGIQWLNSAAAGLPPELNQRFDLVGFDPRGVGASTAIDCDLTWDDAVVAIEAGDDAGWQAEYDQLADTYASCPADALALAPYVGTNNAARDLDQLRAALGDEGLTFVGYSYGTRLGATYAELFPQNVRALVLDAGVLPSDDWTALNAEQTQGFDVAFANFSAACAADVHCLLNELGGAEAVLDILNDELRLVGSFETDDPARRLTRGELSLGVIAALYSVEAWPFLDQALYTAETVGDGTLLQVLGDSLLERQPDGTYSNSQEANTYINCADDPRRPSVEEVQATANATADQSRYFADVFRATTGCSIVAPAIEPLIIGPATGAAPIVVIGNTGDPATPFAWSEALAESLESGVLFTVEGEGHTAYGSFACVTEPITRYLVDLDVPAEGDGCSENATADFFPAENPLAQLDQVVEFYDCVRDEGQPIGPVTVGGLLADPTGEVLLADVDQTSQEFATAVQACRNLLPG